MAFTDAEKTDIRRFCGYPAFGAPTTGQQSYRFFQAYGTLEYRIVNMTTAEEAVTRTTYLGNLNTLEAAIVSSSANLDTDAAAVWTHNKHEVRDRTALFSQKRRNLCEFIGIPAGPGLGSGAIEIVV